MQIDTDHISQEEAEIGISLILDTLAADESISRADLKEFCKIGAMVFSSLAATL